MTSALLESPPRSLFGATCEAAPAGGRGTTLEERLEWAWRAVQAEGHAECPVCGSKMRFERGAGNCTGCGSTLS
jgi:hypothetical protein